MKRFLTVFSVLLTLLLPSVGASAYGIDPVRDSVEVAKFRHRMDSIRQHRPVVALVLSGGGAKGAAHIGVIRRLEELDIPVDMVIGTSMGGLVGGMLSLGYASEEMERVVTGADWSYLITDKMPRETKSLKEVKYRSQHHIMIPFWYQKEHFKDIKEQAYQQEGQPRKYAPMAFGAVNDKKGLFEDNIWESLPESYVRGQNVTNLINSLSVGYADTQDFVDLPIPFCCVASDMVSFKAKHWYEGKLAPALRSTMSIPILFASVRTDGMVLVDGGMRDNYPVGAAKELGADIIIGVELSDAKVSYSEVNNLADILYQGIDMLGADSFAHNENAADVKIKPDLHEYNMLSFGEESIPIIIKRGYDAAVAVDSALVALKGRVGSDPLTFQARRATNINEQYVRINEVEITGVTQKEEDWLMKKIGVVPGGLVNRMKMERVVAEICATQTFENVTYEFLGSGEPYKLVLHCTKGPIHQIGLGLRFDNEEVVIANFNLGFNTRKLQGHRFDFNAKVCVNPYASLTYSYDNPLTPTFNVELKAGYSDLSLFKLGSRTYELNPHRFNSDIWKLKADLFLSNIQWKEFDIKGGIRDEFFAMGVKDLAKYDRMYDINHTTGNYVSLYADVWRETYDSYYYPTKGYVLGLYYGWTFAGTGPWAASDKFHNFHTVALNGRFIVPTGTFFTFIPAFNFRYVGSRENYLNRNDPSATPSIPLPFMNIIGGSLAGRYLDQQIPFIGLNFATCVDNLMLIGRTDYQFQLSKNNYLTAIVNYARGSHMFSTIAKGDNYLGFGVEYGYNTIVGPITVNLHWGATDRETDKWHGITKMPGLYVSFGYNF